MEELQGDRRLIRSDGELVSSLEILSKSTLISCF